MGLDVRVYGNISLVNEDEHWNFHAMVGTPEWDFKIKNLVKGGYYKGDVIFTGVGYSYSGHSNFREDLIRLIGREDLLADGEINWEILPDDIPFYDFINFSDCEGCLDWEISKKIYYNFITYNEKAKELDVNNFYNRYLKWFETFRITSEQNGVVVFS
jgi:hypothetical protein